jgi:hypothetical protein
VARHRRAAAAGEQVEAVAQPVGDLLGRQRPHPRGGQLDSKWNAAELLTDVRDGGRGNTAAAAGAGDDPAEPT